MRDGATLGHVLTGAIERYDTTPQPALGGLAPLQMATLLASDWFSPDSGVSINQKLIFDETQHVRLMQLARELLAFVRDEGPLRVTSRGAFDRATVARAMAQLGLEADFPELEGRPRKVTNEEDCLELRKLRTLLEGTELIVNRKGLVLAKRGYDVMRPERAGALYTELFLGYFADPVLLPDIGDAPEVMLQVLPLAVWRLSQYAIEWTDGQDLAWLCWPMTAEDAPLARFDAPDGNPEFGFTTYSFLLNPLTDLGLLECRELLHGTPQFRNEFRLSPLFHRSFQFHV